MVSKIVHTDAKNCWNLVLQRLDTEGFRPDRFVVSSDCMTDVKILDGPSRHLLRKNDSSGSYEGGSNSCNNSSSRDVPESAGASCLDISIFENELIAKRRRLG